LGKLHFLLVAELNLHGSRLEAVGVAVNENCRPARAEIPEKQRKKEKASAPSLLCPSQICSLIHGEAS
jgi:hypothetical protein